MADLPHIEQGEEVGNLQYIEQREGRKSASHRAVTMGQLGTAGQGWFWPLSQISLYAQTSKRCRNYTLLSWGLASASSVGVYPYP